MRREMSATEDKDEEQRLREDNDRRTQAALERLATNPRKGRPKDANPPKNPVDSIHRLEWLRNREEYAASRKHTNAEPALQAVPKKQLDDYFSGTNRTSNCKQRAKKRNRIEVYKDLGSFSQSDVPDLTPPDVEPLPPTIVKPPPPPQQPQVPPPPENAWAKKPGAALFPGSSSATVVALGVREYNENEMLAKALAESIRTAEQEIVLRSECPMPSAHGYGYATSPEIESTRSSRDTKDITYGYRTDSYVTGRTRENSNRGTINGFNDTRNFDSAQNGDTEETWNVDEEDGELGSDLFSLNSSEEGGVQACNERGNDSRAETALETSLSRQFEACSLQQDTSSSAKRKTSRGEKALFTPNGGRGQQMAPRSSSESCEAQTPGYSNSTEPLSRRNRFAGDSRSSTKSPQQLSPTKATSLEENSNREQGTAPEQPAASASHETEDGTKFTPEHFILMVKDDIPETPSYPPYPPMPYEDMSNFAYDGNYVLPWGTSRGNFLGSVVGIPAGAASPAMSQPNYFPNPAVNYNFVHGGTFPDSESERRLPVNHQVSANQFQNAVSPGYQVRDCNADMRELLMPREQSISPQSDMQHSRREQMENSRQQPNQSMLHSQPQRNQPMLPPGQVLNLQRDNTQSVQLPVRAGESQQPNQSMLQFSQQQLNQSIIHPQQQLNQSALYSQPLPNQPLPQFSQAASPQHQSVQSALHQPQQGPIKSALQPEQMYPMRLPTPSMPEAGQVLNPQLQSGLLGNSAQTLLQSGQLDNMQNMLLGTLSGMDVQSLQLNFMLTQRLLLAQLANSMGSSANTSSAFTTTTPLPNVPQTDLIPDFSKPPPPVPPLHSPKQAGASPTPSNDMHPHPGAGRHMQSGSNYAAQPAGHDQFLDLRQGCGRGRGTRISSLN